MLMDYLLAVVYDRNTTEILEGSAAKPNLHTLHAGMLGFAALLPMFMAPVAAPDDEKLYANYGKTPCLGRVLSR
jgi:hypothetical protein